MDIIFELPAIINNSIKKVKEILSKENNNSGEELIVRGDSLDSNNTNLLYHSDNIEAIKDLLYRGYGESIDLIYIDPPFFTMSNYYNKAELYHKGKKEVIEYLAYTDTWKGGLSEYLEFLTIRLLLMKELLSDKGTIYVHIDFRTVHYIKVIMDYIFGTNNFMNEVIWAYKSGGTSKNYFSRKHDNILVYTKTKNYIFNPQKEKSYNRGFKPYRFKGVKEYEDTLGWYTLVNLKDVWQIDMVGRTSRERLGYDTQKPVSLLERIILSSSNEDSIVADFFSGSGTTISVAEINNRQWIGSDVGNSSILTIMKRLGEMNSPYKKIIYKKEELISDIFVSSINPVDKYNGSYSIRITLDKYLINLDKLKINKKNYKILDDLLKNDSLDLIDYVSIYTKGEYSNVFYEDYRLKDKNRISTEIEFLIEDVEIPLYISVVDIFGYEASKKLIIRKDE